MKRCISLVLTAVLIFILCSCDSSETNRGGYVTSDITPTNLPIIGLYDMNGVTCYTVSNSDETLSFSDMQIAKHTLGTNDEWISESCDWTSELDNVLSIEGHNANFIAIDQYGDALYIVAQSGMLVDNRLIESQIVIAELREGILDCIPAAIDFIADLGVYPQVLGVRAYEDGFIVNTTNGAYALDKTGAVQSTFDTTFDSYVVFNNQIVNLNYSGLSYFDIDSGDEILFNDSVSGVCLQNVNDNLIGYNNQLKTIVALSLSDEGELISEPLLGSEEYLFSGPNCDLLFITSDENENYYVALREVAEYKIYRFEYSEDLLKAPPITIYSLFEAPTIRYAVGLWNQNNPDRPIEYTVGIQTGEENISDVISQLNVQLLSDNPPDLLVMDGLTIDSLIEKGILEDLSSVIDKDLYYQSLVNAYQMDGSLYAVPARFTAPLIGGSTETVNDIINGVDLLQLVENSTPANGTNLNAVNEGNGTPAVVFNSVDGAFEIFYTVWATAIWEGNKLNPQQLTDFLELTKCIVTHNELLTAEELREVYGFESVVTNNSVTNYMNSNAQFYCDNFAHIGTFISGFWDFRTSQEGVGAVTSLIGGDGLAYCLPTSILGIVKGGEKERAEEFMKFILSSPIQNRNFYDGMPVLVDSFHEILEEQCDGYSVRLETNMDSLIENLNPIELLEYPRSVLFEYAVQYYRGDLSLEQVLSLVEEDTRLFFEERQY